MQQFKLLLSFLTVLCIAGCHGTSEEEKTKLNEYQKCLDAFFTNIPLDNCASFATSDSKKRVVQVKKKNDALVVQIQIPECLKQAKQYHQWIAAELNATCLNHASSEFEFNDGGSYIYFSFESDQLPTYISQMNKVLFIDKNVNTKAVAQIKKALLDPKLPSENTYYITSSKKGEIQVNTVVNIELGNEEQLFDVYQKLANLSDHFKSIQFKLPVTFHAIEQYGRPVSSL